MLCENRIDEVVDARNKWLKPDGLIFPNCANLYIAAMNNRLVTDRSNFWEHLYQFDMRPMIPAVNSEPYLQHVNLNQVCRIHTLCGMFALHSEIRYCND